MTAPSKAKEARLPPALLAELLRYEPETGRLYWLQRPESMFPNATAARQWNTKYAGREALNCAFGRGYLCGTVLGQRHLAHRVCWALHAGEWPREGLDHINGDRGDNRLTNLREASPAENQQNKASQKGASSAYVGVSWAKRYGKWRASIRSQGKQNNLGHFDTEEEAFAAYCAAKREMHSFNPVPREVQHGLV